HGVPVTDAGTRGGFSYALSGERRGSRLDKCLRQPSQHHKVSVEAHALQAAGTKWGESVYVLQSSELSLNGDAATIKTAPSLRFAWDERVAAPRLGSATWTRRA